MLHTKSCNHISWAFLVTIINTELHKVSKGPASYFCKLFSTVLFDNSKTPKQSQKMLTHVSLKI